MTKPSKELSLTVKQGFKFLDALGFGLKHAVMLPVRHSNKIYGSVIMLDAVQMMDYPTWRQRFSMRLLPDKNVLKDIYPSFTRTFWCSGMFRASYIDIPSMNITSTLPTRVLLSTLSFHPLDVIVHRTFTASFCLLGDFLSAIHTFIVHGQSETNMPVSPTVQLRTRLTSLYSKITEFPAVHTRMPVAFAIQFDFF